MGFSCGLVGLPNVGKSTLFNALTAAGAAMANYPFCTIEPHVGKVGVPDTRLGVLAGIAQSQRILPAMMAFTDIAGLVKGASKGEGLGNKFLSHIREVDALAHVVRCFEDGDIIHVDGSVDPIRDIGVIDTELALADLEVVEKAIQREQKKARGQDKDAQVFCEFAQRLLDHMQKGAPARSMEIAESERPLLNVLNLMTAKPVLYIANVSEADLPSGRNRHVEAVEKHAALSGDKVIPICGRMEMEIQQLPEDERPAFLADMGLKEPGLNTLIRTGYDLLGLQTYFTVGPKETRAWTVHKGARAPQAAGVIHSDFERGFIRAETISYKDYVDCQGEKGAREKGLLRTEGKDYVMREGDVMHFLFNT